MLGYALIPVAASGVGGVIAAFWHPGKTLKSVIQHFAAGVVLAAAAPVLIHKETQRTAMSMTVLSGIVTGLLIK